MPCQTIPASHCERYMWFVTILLRAPHWMSVLARVKGLLLLVCFFRFSGCGSSVQNASASAPDFICSFLEDWTTALLCNMNGGWLTWTQANNCSLVIFYINELIGHSLHVPLNQQPDLPTNPVWHRRSEAAKPSRFHSLRKNKAKVPIQKASWIHGFSKSMTFSHSH
jgi:hypothetical protein